LKWTRNTSRTPPATRGGSTVSAIKAIEQAIKAAQKGGNAQPRITQAITQVQAGIDAR
jgi:hypothetical protein